MRTAKRVYSFDVFDTAITRSFLHPLGIQLAVAEYISQRCHGSEEAASWVAAIVKMRREAEEMARASSSREEVTLDEIYRAFLSINQLPISVEDCKRQELELEMKSVHPVLEIKNRIEHLRHAGERVIFLSDMYLPGPFIRKMLQKCGMDVEGKDLYVSGDYGVTKRSGNLYRLVLKKEAIDPQQLIHTGDHRPSDFVVPRRMNIRANLFERVKANRYEKLSWELNVGNPWRHLVIGGISRASRLAWDQGKDRSPAVSIAVDVAAPLLVFFVLWIMKQAQRDQIQRIYFVGRSGQVLLKIASRLSNHMPSPELRYLYLSRQSLFLPSQTDIHMDHLSWVFINAPDASVSDFLRRLNIRPAEIEGTLKRYGFRETLIRESLDPAALQRFKRVLCDPLVVGIIQKKVMESRTVILRYLKQEELGSKSIRWAYADVGWSLKCQRALYRLLKVSGGTSRFIGYYLGLLHDRVSDGVDFGAYRAVGYGDFCFGMPESLSSTLFGAMNFIECVFMPADHGRTEGYREVQGKVEPVLSKVDREEQELARQFHRYLLTYVDILAETDFMEPRVELLAYALSALKELFSAPTEDEALALSRYQVGMDQNELRMQRMAGRLTLRDLLTSRYFLPPKKYEDTYFWREGSLARSSPWMRTLFKIRARMREA